MNSLGKMLLSEGNDPAAYQLIKETLEVFRELGDKHRIATTLVSLGTLAEHRAAIGMLNRSTRRASHSVANSPIHSSSRHHSPVSVASRLDRATMQQRGPIIRKLWPSLSRSDPNRALPVR